MGLYRKTYVDKTGKKRTAKKWTLEYYERGRRYRVALEVTNLRAAKMKAAEIMRALEFKSVGVETHETTRSIPLSDLTGEYVAELRRRGRSKSHLRQVVLRLGGVLAGIKRLDEATPERLRGALTRLQKERELAPLTTNWYRMAAHGFFVWLVQEGRWQSNPVKAVKPVRVLGPAVRRRALTEEELQRLLEVAPTRSTVYLTAATTGLRRNELATLTNGDLDLAGSSLTVRARNAKNRRESVIPLPAITVAALRTHLGTRTTEPGARAFTSVPNMRTFYRDLVKAGIPRRTGDERIDFHSLRVTYATMLARSGVSLALAQKLMRHSDPKLTASVYTRFEMHDGRAAVSKLDARLAPPDLGGACGPASQSA